MRRIAFRLSTAIMFFAALGAAACSHRTAYVRLGVEELAETARLDPGMVETRVVLVGDAGEVDARGLEDVGEWVRAAPDRTVTLFLGDNMYPEGMTPGHRTEADRRLLPQIQAGIAGGGRAVFVPGNHDWADGGDGGMEAILAQAEYVGARSDRAVLLPAGACPGPVALDDLAGVRIIVLDTQWWLHAKEKPQEACPSPDTAAVIARFAVLLKTDRHVIVAAHHPLWAYGRHAGFSDWRDHAWPPVVGTLIALSRKLGLRDQDLNSTRYSRMAEAFEAAFESVPRGAGLRIWAAGHEHSLQILDGGPSIDYLLVSGSAAKTNPVNHGDDTRFAESRNGFIVLDVLADSRVLARVVAAGEVRTFPLEPQPLPARAVP